MQGTYRSLRSMSEAIHSKQITSKELLDYYLKSIDEIEHEVLAWAFIDKSNALEKCNVHSTEAKKGNFRGPLHGIPIAIKDNMDVKGMPTKVGSKIWDSRKGADRNSSIVELLEQLGAIVVGKTHMTEYAWLDPAPTKNPRNYQHTPGGSSSGSAAAVAANMIPLALGTQTAASVCRPGVYCGIVAFKPTKIEIFTDAVPLSATFDTIGFFTHYLDDVAFLMEHLLLENEEELKMEGVNPSKVGIIADSLYEIAQDEVKRTFKDALAELRKEGHEIIKITPKVSFSQLIQWHRIVMAYEASKEYYNFVCTNQQLLSKNFKDLVFKGREITKEHYEATLVSIEEAKKQFWGENNVDFYLAMPTNMVAPEGIHTTGSPLFTTPWTVLGGPLLTLPYEILSNNLSTSIMVASKPHSDRNLLRFGEILEKKYITQ